MNMSDIIDEIERTFPDLKWLVRSTEEADRLPAYFSHICNSDYSLSFQGGSDDSPEDALLEAFDKAVAAEGKTNA